MADDVQVRFGAEISGLAAGVEGVKNKLHEVQDAGEKAGKSLNESFEEVNAVLKDILSPIAVLHSAMRETAEIAGAMLVADKLKEWVAEADRAALATVNLAHSVGMAPGEMRQLQNEMVALGGSADTMGRTLSRLERNMSQALSNPAGQAAKAFEALGVSTQDLQSHQNDLSGMLDLLRERFSSFADGPAKTAIGFAIMGRSFETLMPLMEMTAAEHKEFADAVREANEATDEELASGAAVAVQMNLLGLATEGTTEAIVNEFNPGLSVALAALTQMVEVIERDVEEGGLLADIVSVIGQGFAGLANVITMVVATVSAGVGILEGYFKAMGEAVRGDLTGAVKTLQEASEAAGKAVDDTVNKILDAVAKAAAAEAIQPAKAPKRPNAPQMEGASGAQMTQWRAELDTKLADQKAYFNDALAIERAFWAEKLGLVKAGSQEEAEIKKQIYELDKAAAHQAVSEHLAALTEQQAAAKNDWGLQMALEAQKLDYIKSIYGEESAQYQSELRKREGMLLQHIAELYRIEMQGVQQRETADKESEALFKAGLAAQVVDHQLSKQQELGFEIQYAAQVFQTESAMLQQIIAAHVAAGDLTLQEYQQLYDKLAALQANYLTATQTSLTQLTTEQQAAAQKSLAAWQQMFDGIGNSMTSAMRGLVDGTETWKTAWQKVMRGITDSTFDAMEKVASGWAAKGLAPLLGVKFGEGETPSMSGLMTHMLGNMLGLNPKETAQQANTTALQNVKSTLDGNTSALGGLKGAIEGLTTKLQGAGGSAAGGNAGGFVIGPDGQIALAPGAAGGGAYNFTGGAAGAAPVVRKYESGGNYNIGYGRTDLSNAPLDQYGFPQWAGKAGPAGMSHAAGAYQFEPKTWAQYAGPMGIHDFSPESQDRVFNAAFGAQGFGPWSSNAKLMAAVGRGEAGPGAAAGATSDQQIDAIAQGLQKGYNDADPSMFDPLSENLADKLQGPMATPPLTPVAAEHEYPPPPAGGFTQPFTVSNEGAPFTQNLTPSNYGGAAPEETAAVAQGVQQGAPAIGGAVANAVESATAELSAKLDTHASTTDEAASTAAQSAGDTQQNTTATMQNTTALQQLSARIPNAVGPGTPGVGPPPAAPGPGGGPAQPPTAMGQAQGVAGVAAQAGGMIGGPVAMITGAISRVVGLFQSLGNVIPQLTQGFTSLFSSLAPAAGAAASAVAPAAGAAASAGSSAASATAIVTAITTLGVTLTGDLFENEIAIVTAIWEAAMMQMAAPKPLGFASGLSSVPHDMFAQIHEGEMIVPKDMANVMRSGMPGLAKALPAFDVGAWDVPHNMSANVHAGEMIMPAPFAAGLRSTLAGATGGPGGQGGPGGKGGVNFTYAPTIHHNEPTTLDQLLVNEGQSALGWVQGMARNGGFNISDRIGTS